MKPRIYIFPPYDWVPNNARMPVVIYRGASGGGPDHLAQTFERRFAAHGWVTAWRDVIFDYQHYHSTAHEALAAVSGSAELMLGGPGGTVIDFAAGDVVVLPAGTGHCQVAASDDFLAIGAYPQGQTFDICRQAPDAATRRRIDTLPIPREDPLEGAGGAFVRVARLLAEVS